MKRKVGVASALAVLAASVGSSPVLSQESEGGVAACANYMQIEDRAALQDELSRLLIVDPNNICIDMIVDILGGSPLAQVTQTLNVY